MIKKRNAQILILFMDDSNGWSWITSIFAFQDDDDIGYIMTMNGWRYETNETNSMMLIGKDFGSPELPQKGKEMIANVSIFCAIAMVKSPLPFDLPDGNTYNILLLFERF